MKSYGGFNLMKCVLHIGLSKTGTSAIQNFLWNNRAKLLESYRILYPETGIFSGGEIFAHYFIVWSIFKSKDVEIKKIPSKSEIKKSLISELKNKEALSLLISCESFMHLQNEYLIQLKNFLYEIVDNLSIIVYLRRQDLWCESSYLQVAKVKHGFKNSFNVSVRYTLENLEWLLNYYRFLKNWQKAFPDAQIIPRIYDKKLFPEGNVILDFLSVLGLDIPEAKTEKIEANPSLSHLSTLVLLRINEEFNLSQKDHIKVIQYLFELDKVDRGIIKTFFSLQERIKFLEHFRESNERVFKEYFSMDNQFILSEEEIKFYEEQDKIPAEVKDRAVEERFRHVLDFMK